MLMWRWMAGCAVQDGVEELRLLGMQPNRETYALLLKACAGKLSPTRARHRPLRLPIHSGACGGPVSSRPA
jgi:hypothetical protein